MLIAYYEIEHVYNDDYDIWKKHILSAQQKRYPKIVLQPKVGIFWNMLVAYPISVGIIQKKDAKVTFFVTQ